MGQIYYDLPGNTYLPGQVVKGSVNLVIDKPVKARAVQLDILGLEKTRVVVGSGNSSRTYIEKNYILKDKIYLYPPEAGGEHEFEPGTYKNEIQFKIPDSAPPSYEGNNVDTKYWLKTRVDVLLWGDIVNTKPFYVVTKKRNLGSFTDPATFESHNFKNPEDKKPGFYVELSREAFGAGRSIEGLITISNKDACKIRKIDLRLKGTEEVKAKGNVGIYPGIIYESEFPCDNLIEGEPVRFRIPIPNDITCSYKGKNSSLKWTLEVQLDLPFRFDISAQCPVEIIR
jgi:hypothetical protein